MATWYKTSTFKYLKNLIIGVGAALVMLGALFKIESLPYSSEFLTIGLVTEAILFLMLGLLPPDKDYYWEKLYPGIEDYHGDVPAILPGIGAIDAAHKAMRALDADKVEDKLDGIHMELQGMSKSMSSLKALQEIDFSKTKDQLKSVNDFYGKMNEAFMALQGSVEDAKKTQVELGLLSKSLNSMNGAYEKMNETFQAMQASSNDAKLAQEQIKALAQNLTSMNKVYGNMLSAMSSK
ncbi:MAG: gliding motility protein GldL [Saprospiraceae bacterium]